MLFYIIALQPSDDLYVSILKVPVKIIGHFQVSSKHGGFLISLV